MAFTLKKFLQNEDLNLHTENALMLVKTFGSDAEIAKIQKIKDRQEEVGYLENSYERDTYIKKYLPYLGK